MNQVRPGSFRFPQIPGGRAREYRPGAGKDVQVFVQDMITKQALRPSLDDILAPVRREFEESGMSRDELDSFMNSVREKAYQDKQDKL